MLSFDGLCGSIGRTDDFLCFRNLFVFLLLEIHGTSIPAGLAERNVHYSQEQCMFMDGSRGNDNQKKTKMNFALTLYVSNGFINECVLCIFYLIEDLGKLALTKFA